MSVMEDLKGYFLNGYISDSVQLIEGDSRTYKIVTYQQEHKDEYTIYAMQGNKENGSVQHFDRGVIRYSWEMKDGKRCGYVTTYEKGKACHKYRCHGSESEEHRVLENCKVGLRMTIRDESGAIRFYGMCDESLRKNGYGIEYDVKTGRPLFCGLFRNDIQTHVFQEFHADDTMTEYMIDEASNLPLLKRIPVYIGGYAFTESELYVRNGVGSLIDPSTGFASKECTWKNGEMVDSVLLHNGWYCYKDETISLRGNAMLTKPSTTKLQPSTTKLQPSTTKLQPSAMTKNVSTLVIPDDYENSAIQCLDFNDYPKLTTLTIGNDCLRHVTRVQIVSMEVLKSVKIGRRSFSSEKALARLHDVDVVEETELWVENCPHLKKLRVGAMSFMEYASLRLENLPSLSEIRIGEEETSKCFFHCRQLLIQSFPALKKVAIGNGCFCRTPLSLFGNCPVLQSLLLDRYSLEGIKNGVVAEENKLILLNLPELRKFVASLNNFIYTKKVVVEDTPNVETIDFSFTSFSKVVEINENNGGKLGSRIRLRRPNL